MLFKKWFRVRAVLYSVIHAKKQTNKNLATLHFLVVSQLPMHVRHTINHAFNKQITFLRVRVL